MQRLPSGVEQIAPRARRAASGISNCMPPARPPAAMLPIAAPAMVSSQCLKIRAEGSLPAGDATARKARQSRRKTWRMWRWVVGSDGWMRRATAGEEARCMTPGRASAFGIGAVASKNLRLE